MAPVTDVALFTFQQAFIVTRMWRMAGHAAVIAVTYEVIVRGGQLIADIRMTFKTGVNQNRLASALMAIRAVIRIGFMQYIPDQGRPVTAVRVVAGAAVPRFFWKIGMFLPYCGGRVTFLTQLLGFCDQQVGIFRLVRLMAGSALSL